MKHKGLLTETAFCRRDHAHSRTQDYRPDLRIRQDGRYRRKVGGRLEARISEIRSYYPETRVQCQVHGL